VNITSPTIDARAQSRDAGRRTDPLRSDRAGLATGTHLAPPATALATMSGAALSAAARRQRAQLPTFAPLLEEVELAGWSSHRHCLSGNFHDWMLLDDGHLLLAVGRGVRAEHGDPADAALAAQAAWTAIRAHALHTRDAGTLLSLAARTLWPLPEADQQASVAVALVDAVGGRASIAVAGDCQVWRVRAASCDPLDDRQPPLGTNSHFPYMTHEIELCLRERLLLVADNPDLRSEKSAASLAADFSRLEAETHRRMTAADALAMLRPRYDRAAETNAAAETSLIVLRRR
jgi:hypothetical protein